MGWVADGPELIDEQTVGWGTPLPERQTLAAPCRPTGVQSGPRVAADQAGTRPVSTIATGNDGSSCTMSAGVPAGGCSSSPGAGCL